MHFCVVEYSITSFLWIYVYLFLFFTDEVFFYHCVYQQWSFWAIKPKQLKQLKYFSDNLLFSGDQVICKSKSNKCIRKDFILTYPFLITYIILLFERLKAKYRINLFHWCLYQVERILDLVYSESPYTGYMYMWFG